MEAALSLSMSLAALAVAVAPVSSVTTSGQLYKRVMVEDETWAPFDTMTLVG